MLGSLHFTLWHRRAIRVEKPRTLARPLRMASLFVIASLLYCKVAADEPTPYVAYVVSDEVYVRSGPGKNYYPTLKLARGDCVEVYRHDPGGWFAIRPPDGSFSWVAGEFVKPGEDGLGVIIGDRVVARVGSAFSDIRDVIQVRLNRGEELEILEAKQFNPGPAAQTWYKINPPSGEFRWIHGKFVSREKPEDPAAETGPRRNLLLPQEDVEEESPEAENAEGSDAEPELIKQTEEPELTLLESGTERKSRDRAIATEIEQAAAAEDAMPADEESEAGEPDHEAPTGKMPHRRSRPRNRALSREDAFHAELDQLDLELSAMVAEEPTAWNFDDLVARARVALEQARTPVERGHARLLLGKIEKFAELKRRMDSIAQMSPPPTTPGSFTNTAPLAAISPTARSEFDGVGRLARVRSALGGLPGYALTDDTGTVRSFVTPAPGINLRSYVGQQVGINGSVGYLPQYDRQNVTARRITILPPDVIRR